jgi:hypothetical protein
MLPSNALFTRKRESAAGRRFRTNVQPQQGSSGYSGGNTITVNIPTGVNQLMIPSESTLNFTLNAKNNSGAAVTLFRFDSCGAHSLIERVRVWHGSNLLEDITSYGQLAKMLFDYQVPQDAAAGRHSVVTGTRSDAYALPQSVSGDFPAAYAAADVATGVNKLAPVKYSNSGASMISGSLATNGTVTKHFSLNLISLVGSLSAGKYLPLFAMTSSPLRVEIQLVSNLNSACALNRTSANSGTAVTWTLDDVEFVGEFLQMSDQAISTIMSASDSPLQFVHPAFSNYQYSAKLAVGTTQVSIPVAAKYSSLKGLITSIREPAAGVSTVDYYPYSSHPFNLSEAAWRIGSQVVPSKALTKQEEFFTETLKVFGSLSDQLYQPAVEIDSYNLNLPVDATNGEPDKSGAGGANIGSGSFALGLDLEVFAGSDKDAFFQGINTNTDDIFINVKHSGVAAETNVRYDTFALYDCVLVCENGVAYSRF